MPTPARRRHVPQALADAILLSVRLTARADGAPGRCRRQDCRKSGRCHLALDEEGTGLCPGGISEAALDQAALMITFLAELSRPR